MFLFSFLLALASAHAGDCKTDLCKGQKLSQADFDRKVSELKLQHVMTLDTGLKTKGIGMLYAKVAAPSFANFGGFEKFYVIYDSRHHQLVVEEAFEVSALKREKALYTVEGTTVISVRLRRPVEDRTGLVLDLKLLSEYNVVFSNDYSTRHISLELSNGNIQAYYLEPKCERSKRCQGVPFDFVWVQLRPGRMVEYVGIRKLSFGQSGMERFEADTTL